MPAKAVDTSVEETTQAANKLIADAQRTFGETARRLEKTLQESLEQLRAQSRVYADAAGEHLDEGARYVSEKVRERPLAAAGAALGVGVLIGLLLSSGRR
jgi:ElaB/YqjD/DUF883 family membrane-anchored ribosome-binding protein